ncbi:PREDICTED: ferritin heavy polypeptide-like 17 [Dufourea novaeangliae]|uniref:Ferritin n=1 Tax=Dufourea novaeangliae TaxID=178035 RepID=A0A154P2J8_DUFNO|nr:PREDICTED: ferritin heavy polypeptide-like 17 [Dufourea novaeangliae]KZC05564.1 Ferritin, lower subunit [Dufourea novaeangliae]
MLSFGILSILLAVASAEFCYPDVEKACGTTPIPADEQLMPNCNAKYGAIQELQADLQAYASANIESSFEFLLMSSFFGNYEANRDGFKKLYRKYSDQLWEDSINVIKYITKRGGEMNFNQLPRIQKSVNGSRVLELNELNSLAKALDTQKQLATEALRIHSEAMPYNKHDAAVAHYIEEQFLEGHTERVRELAGYTTELKSLSSQHNPAVSVFLFDEILKKSL